MKYRILKAPGGETLIIAEGGKPATRYAQVLFENTWSVSDAVRHVARYVAAVREASTPPQTARMNAEVRDDNQ